MEDLVFIIGFMGSGKDTVGKALSELLNFGFVDTDHELEQVAGMPVSSIFRKFGESHFREIEHQVVVGCSVMNHTVVSCGGGAPCFHDGINLMNQGGTTVFLDVDFDSTYERIRNSDRPLLDRAAPLNQKEDLRSLFNKRLQDYKQAKYIIDGNSLSPDEIAIRIREMLQNGDAR